MSFTYTLMMELSQDKKITVGKLGTILFKKGTYIYVGSAPSEKRLQRHLRKEKKIFWHIDYFLQEAQIKEICIVDGEECEVADKIDLPFIKRFGCSDCKCPSHLFYGELPDFFDKRTYYP
ncbi:MAG: GIY-YIG nuclease family protein [Theionarchaea archaeon]|nr:GIY-YIG nuclease family protein [Theionarchaea archaeon]